MRWLRNNLFLLLILNKESFLPSENEIVIFMPVATLLVQVYTEPSRVESGAQLTLHTELFNRSLGDPVKSFVHPVEAFFPPLLTVTRPWFMSSRPKTACHPPSLDIPHSRNQKTPKQAQNANPQPHRGPRNQTHPAAHIKCKHPQHVWSLGSLVRCLFFLFNHVCLFSIFCSRRCIWNLYTLVTVQSAECLYLLPTCPPTHTHTHTHWPVLEVKG